MAWLILIIAGFRSRLGSKYAESFTRLWPTVWTAISMLISLVLLGIVGLKLAAPARPHRAAKKFGGKSGAARTRIE
jgi:hypothetical protein